MYLNVVRNQTYTVQNTYSTHRWNIMLMSNIGIPNINYKIIVLSEFEIGVQNIGN